MSYTEISLVHLHLVVKQQAGTWLVKRVGKMEPENTLSYSQVYMYYTSNITLFMFYAN